MHVYKSVLDLIGNTPIVRINNMDTGPCELVHKAGKPESRWLN